MIPFGYYYLARERGLIADQLNSTILAQAEQLIELLEVRRLGTWLASYCAAPFDLAALGERPDWAYRKHKPGDPDGWPKEQ
jgi:hypothetical protein